MIADDLALFNLWQCYFGRFDNKSWLAYEVAMGLLYPFPVEQDEVDHVVVKDHWLMLKSYGLPYLFWGYLLAGLAALFTMAMAIADPLKQMLQSQDGLNVWLASLSALAMVGTALGFSAPFFIEFRLCKRREHLVKALYFMGIVLFRRQFKLASPEALSVVPFRGSPNVARLENRPQSSLQQNRGYFELYLRTAQGEQVLLDRHSRKADLEKLRTLLEKF